MQPEAPAARGPAWRILKYPGGMRIATALMPPVSVHPAEHELQTFMRGALPPPKAAPIVHHLLSGCTECLQVTRPLWELMQPRPKAGGGRSWRGGR